MKNAAFLAHVGVIHWLSVAKWADDTGLSFGDFYDQATPQLLASTHWEPAVAVCVTAVAAFLIVRKFL